MKSKVLGLHALGVLGRPNVERYPGSAPKSSRK